MRLVAFFFVVVHSLAALALFALGVHGPAWTAPGAGLYLACAVGLIAWAGSRKSWRFLLAAGVLMLAVPPGIFVLLERMEQARYEERVAATRVREMRDEPIVSAAGRPIGVRLSFVVSVPHSGSYAISPSLYGAEGLYLNATRRTLDGRADAWEYEAGRAHQQSAELYPPLLMRSADGAPCLSRLVPVLPRGAERVPLRIAISDTPYAGRTRGTYDLAELYRNVIAEGLPACKVGP